MIMESPAASPLRPHTTDAVAERHFTHIYVGRDRGRSPPQPPASRFLERLV